jgi:hypothetical protein
MMATGISKTKMNGNLQVSTSDNGNFTFHPIWRNGNSENRLYYGDNLFVMHHLLNDETIKGNIRLIYIALFFFILDFISIDSDNPGGHIAHLGGALMGFWFAKSYLKGKDLTAGMNALLDKIVDFFTKKTPQPKMTHRRPETDYDYNRRRSENNKEIDRILDKIKKSGYNSLSDEEKKTLFNARR